MSVLKRGKYLFVLLLLTLLYITSGLFILKLFHAETIISVARFPPEGFALFFILFFGKKVAPGIFFGQLFLALLHGVEFSAALFIATINTLEALLGLYLFKKFHYSTRLTTFEDIFFFLTIVLLILQPFSAILSNLFLLYHDSISEHELLFAIFSWWFGNAMAQITLTPFLLYLAYAITTINLKEFLLYGATFGLYVAILEFVVQIQNSYLLLAMTLPFIIFTLNKRDLTFGLFLNAILTAVTTMAVANGYIAFAQDTPFNNTIDYNFFILLSSIMTWFVGILLEERKKYEKQLQKKIQEEVAKNQKQQQLLFDQSRFALMGETISTIAHHWRQPLNNLSLSIELLAMEYKKKKLTQERFERFYITTKGQIKLLTQTINTFRDYFQEDMNKEYFSLLTTIQEALAIMKEELVQNSITLDFHNTKEIQVYGIKALLLQAILQILKNSKEALQKQKSSNKKITLNIYEDANYAIISILDNGGGIDKSIIHKVFEPYFSTKTQKNQTGLGLYMTKISVENQLNGTLELVCHDKGVEFIIRIPKNES